jgi:hypothetical protein
VSEFQWTRQRQIAAQLVAEGDKSNTEIAQRTGVTPYTITKWSKNPDFIDRVAEIRAEMAQALKRAGLRVRENRLRALNDDFERTQKVINGRAKAHFDVPGGESGLLVRRIRHSGEEYVFDAAVLRERREYMKQAAIELGEWIEKQQLDAGDGKPLPIDVRLTIDKVYSEAEPEKTDVNGTEQKAISD